MGERVEKGEWERVVGELRNALGPLGFRFEGEKPMEVRFFYDGEAALRLAPKGEGVLLGLLALQAVGRKGEVEKLLVELPPIEKDFREKADLLRVNRSREEGEALGYVWAVFSLSPEEVSPERVLSLAKAIARWSLRVKGRFASREGLTLLSPLSPLLVAESG